MTIRDLAYVYRDLREAGKMLISAITDTEFLSAQARFEQVEAEWLALGTGSRSIWKETSSEQDQEGQEWQGVEGQIQS